MGIKEKQKKTRKHKEITSLFFPEPPKKYEDTWNKLWLWLGIAFVLRAIIALAGDFVLHPDEVMQYLEPAHKAVFGTGVAYWEFIYGARSWLVPSFVAGILWIMKTIALDQPSIYVYVVKLAFCAVSLLIPWGAYHVARYFYNESTGRLSLILTCLWPYLVVFGHKPFTEFVATAVFFAILGFMTMPRATKSSGALITGLMLAFVPFLRIQYLFVAGFTWLYYAINRRSDWVFISFIGGVIMIVLIGYFEVITWGGKFLFHSYYVNIYMNILIAEIRPPEPWYFFLPRIFLATAGLIILSFVSFVLYYRRSLLFATIIIVLIVFHSLQVHKELRFVFLIHPVILITAASVIAFVLDKISEEFTLNFSTAFTSLLLVLISTNVIDDRYLHEGNSNERGEPFYIFGQNNIFDVYFELSKMDNVKGVMHFGDPYYNTPGFYYLHQDVPFYQSDIINQLTQDPRFQGIKPNELFSHAVIPPGIAIEGFSLVIQGDYNLLVADNIIPVKEIVTNSPEIVAGDMHYAIVQKGLSKIDIPVFPEFKD